MFARARNVALALAALAGAAQAQQAMESKPMMDPQPMNGPHAMMKDPVTYTVILKGRWTAANFPLEYPAGAHFSGLIGASHAAGYHLFQVGAMPSPGIERLSEMGRHQPLDAEINAAVASHKAGMLFTSGPLKDFGDSVVTTVTVDSDHPFVSLVAMIAPSPDWFAGVADVDLRDMGAMGSFAARKSVELWAYDSGGDDGTTYMAPDKDTDPKRATTRNAARHFAPNGSAMPVATVTFIRK